MAVTGCATTGTFFQREAPEPGGLWDLPTDSYPTQRLYRIKYRGPEGEAGFKLVLYLESEQRYRMLATDLGRKLWSLSVEEGTHALWLDHRNKEYCRSDAASELRFVPLADLPLIALPKLLLGLMPAEPAASLNRSDGKVSFLDERGQLWNGRLSGERLEWWSLIEDGEPIVWWRREEKGGVFSDREGGQEVSWSEVVRERLDGSLEELEVPGRFRPGECGTAASR